MMTICRNCKGAQNVRLRRGRHIKGTACERCGHADLAPAHSQAPKEYREAGDSWAYAWGAQVATSGGQRYEASLNDRARDAWYAGYDAAAAWAPPIPDWVKASDRDEYAKQSTIVHPGWTRDGWLRELAFRFHPAMPALVDDGAPS